MLVLDKPLGEGAVAVVTETQRLLNVVERRIETAAGELERCRVPYDTAKVKRLLADIDAVYSEMCNVTLAHLDALEAAH